MRVCIVTEGCYPYVVGGVSGWINSLIKAFPGLEFSVLSIVPDRSFRGKFVYELPENVVEVSEVYLNDLDWADKKSRKPISSREYASLRSLVMSKNVDWEGVFDFFISKDRSMNDLLMGSDFFNIVSELYDKEYPEIAFTDFLWTLRSVYLPMFQALNSELPKADIYHCVATGYAGILGCISQYKYGGGLILSEHGIYTREREEELIKADWVQGIYKNIWIEQFKKMSQVVYDRAQKVISLFEHARELQIELGCPEEKTMVIPNGVEPDLFRDIPGKDPDDPYVNIGALVRITPIKDIKSLIQAFSIAKKKAPSLKLWIMGPDSEDEQYARECYDYVDYLNVEDIVFTGRINTRDYIGKMDATILTSISEGQPLTILESYAAGKPAIATDVGNCRGLIYGEQGDTLGDAGILTHVMNTEEIADAMVQIAVNKPRAARMGEVGYRRVMSKYLIKDMRAAYAGLYRSIGEEMGIAWQE
ncbi:MAG: GT4 family glycosyltransferase PelF [Clostridia bacterium]|nr:GT4 family glycosyltransferase PelF [Clostridia bacterium]